MTKLSEFLSANVRPDLARSMAGIAETSLKISKQLPLLRSSAGGINPSGDTQTGIDVFANDAFVSSLIAAGEVAEVASEEMDRPRRGRGALHISMDPLDGSSNIATNNPLGSIFGFYSSALPCSGAEMLAAAFVTYGPMLTITFSSGKGVQRFVAVEDGGRRDFVLVNDRVRIPERGDVFGFGGLRKDWVDPVKRFVASLEERGMKLRYGGTFVGDFNQVLEYGGIFAYPALRNRPDGKLRVLYEAAPVAFIAREAGGYASDGGVDVLSLRPTNLAQTCPIYVGSEPLVRELEKVLSGRS